MYVYFIMYVCVHVINFPSAQVSLLLWGTGKEQDRDVVRLLQSCGSAVGMLAPKCLPIALTVFSPPNR